MVANSPHYSPYFKSTCLSDHNVIFLFGSPCSWCSKWHHNYATMMLQPGVTTEAHSCPSSPLTRDGHSCPSSPLTRDGHRCPSCPLTRDGHRCPSSPLTRDGHRCPSSPLTRDGHRCPSGPLTRDGHRCPSSPVRLKAQLVRYDACTHIKRTSMYNVTITQSSISPQQSS